MPDSRISELPAATAPFTDGDLSALVQSSGGTLQTRRATLSQLRTGILNGRTAHVNDYGARGDGVTDDAPAIQAAITDLGTRFDGGVLQFGARRYRIASPIVVQGVCVRLQGEGFTEGTGTGDGTFLTIAGNGFTPITFRGAAARGGGLRDLAFVQSHPASTTPGWAPTSHPYVVRVEDCLGGIDIDNVFLTNIDRGIYCLNSGRLDIRRLRGQVFTAGVEIDRCFDVPRVHNLHFWPFWSDQKAVLDYTQANGDALIFRRCDGVFIDQAFAFGYRSMFRFSSSADGVTTKFTIGSAYADFVRYGVWIEGNGTDGQIGSLTVQGETFFNAGAPTPYPPLPGAYGVFIPASNTRVQIGNLRIDDAEDNAIRVNGTNNRLDIFAIRCVVFNSRANGSAAIHLATSGAAPINLVNLGSPPLLENGSGGPLLNPGTNGQVAIPGTGGGSGGTGGAVSSVAGRIGAVTLAVADVAGAASTTAPVFAGPVQVNDAGGGNLARIVGGAAGSPVILGVDPLSAGTTVGAVLGTPKGGGAIAAQLADNAAPGGNPRGTNAVDWQTSRGAAVHVAAGNGSVIAGGTANLADGSASWIPGGTRATTRATYGRGAWSSGTFGTQPASAGDAQAGEAVLRARTIDATATRLTSDAAAAAAGNSLPLPNNGAYLVRLLVIARQTTAAGAAAGWETTVLLKRGNVVTATIALGGGTDLVPTFNDAGAATWRLSVGADAVNGGIAVTGTGEAAKTINWVARVLSVETSV